MQLGSSLEGKGTFAHSIQSATSAIVPYTKNRGMTNWATAEVPNRMWKGDTSDDLPQLYNARCSDVCGRMYASSAVIRHPFSCVPKDLEACVPSNESTSMSYRFRKDLELLTFHQPFLHMHVLREPAGQVVHPTELSTVV